VQLDGFAFFAFRQVHSLEPSFERSQAKPTAVVHATPIHAPVAAATPHQKSGLISRSPFFDETLFCRGPSRILLPDLRNTVLGGTLRMDWNQLLSARRLSRPDGTSSKTRSAFQQDADLVVFSAAFRRLQDKTQVQPLSEGGHVRTRLTHSIEVASVGRSLGTAAADALKQRRGLDDAQCQAFASIVHAACLAHDIGNPPFGHGGEDAIQAFFRERPSLLMDLSLRERADFEWFDGNAQGFRILTQLENYRFDGGLRLTHGTLGAFMKYAVTAGSRDPTGAQIAARKPGFFCAEEHYAAELRENLRLPFGTRHPLAYLTEAADDICYAIVDIEDGHDAGFVDHREAVEVLSELADSKVDPRLDRDEQIHKLRGIAIGRLIDAVGRVFVDVEPTLLMGQESPELISLTPLGAGVTRAKALAAERIFAAPAVVERLIGGQRVLTGLLEALMQAVDSLQAVGFERAALSGAALPMVRLVGESYRPGCRYDALLGMTDFLSGLTDRAALKLNRRLNGVGL